ncbi:Protein bassoon [Liparis tanakae]|uniref:Protein bassoon n=1 Tax=Liparis tanakae TaxID=230148 RepID=A0A4Z2J7S8_9TELE|nr:Protein bassoon [Liparis tanakae]
MPSTREIKPAAVQKSVKDKTQEPRQPTEANPAGQARVDRAPLEAPEASVASHHVPGGGGSTCPLCQVALNMHSKDPPNYNVCTECKSTVCNQCGFNPMPNVNEGKQWLCLNCQVKRAASGIEPQKDSSLVNSSFKKTTPAPPALQKSSAPGSPQMKVSTPAVQPVQTDTAKGPDRSKQASPAPGQKTPQQSRTTPPQKQPQQTSQTTQKQRNATAATDRESGMSVGPGGPKSQPDVTKPAVTGKMFGFGSSIFSSASNLITSAVQDEPKTTPPRSPKMPAAKDSKYATATKSEQEKKPEQPQQAKSSPSVQLKAEKLPSEPRKTASASPVVSKAGPSACLLCKVELNVGSKDPPNYNTCTECKHTVCNQCGFNPMTNVKERKPPTPAVQTAKVEVRKGPESQKQVSPAPVIRKAGQPTCPLCKVELNCGSKQPPNYNKCTECKIDVCDQCGFNPMPNDSKVKEWLCLNCQMQRALRASEPTGPHNTGNKISPLAVQRKITAPNQVETLKRLSTSDAPSKMETSVPDFLQKKGSPTPGSPQKTQSTKAAKGPERGTQASPTPGQKTPLDIQGTSASQKPTDQPSELGLKQSKLSINFDIIRCSGRITYYTTRLS